MYVFMYVGIFTGGAGPKPPSASPRLNRNREYSGLDNSHHHVHKLNSKLLGKIFKIPSEPRVLFFSFPIQLWVFSSVTYLQIFITRNIHFIGLYIFIIYMNSFLNFSDNFKNIFFAYKDRN